MGAASSSASTSATQINLFAALWIVQRGSAAGLGGSGGGLVVRRGMAGVSAPRVGRGKRRGATQGRGRYSPWNVRSLQSGLTIAPSLPHLLHRIRGPSDSTSTSSGQVSTLTFA